MIVILGPLSERLHGCNWKVAWTNGTRLPTDGKACDTMGEVMQTIMLLMQQMEQNWATKKNETITP